MPTLLGVFDRPSDVASAVHKLRGRGLGDVESYSPAPFEEVDDAVRPGPSPVELSVLVGSFCWFSMFFLMFLKLFPIIAIAEIKELLIHDKAHGGKH